MEYEDRSQSDVDDEEYPYEYYEYDEPIGFGGFLTEADELEAWEQGHPDGDYISTR